MVGVNAVPAFTSGNFQAPVQRVSSEVSVRSSCSCGEKPWYEQLADLILGGGSAGCSGGIHLIGDYDAESDQPDIPENYLDDSPQDERDAIDECEIGTTQQSYSGPLETEYIGVCQPQIEECQETEEGSRWQIIQEETLPSAEICDGLDNDCDGEITDEEWNRTFGGADYDEARSVQQTEDGGFILAGYTASFGAGNADAWLIKTDSLGNEEWSKTFGGGDSDQAWSVQQTEDGGFILAGNTFSFGAGNADAWLIKTDGSGNEEWSRTFDREGTDDARSVQQTEDGGFILAGNTFENGDAWLIKTDDSGNEEWSRTFGGGGADKARSVQQTRDGGFILAGYTASFGAGNADAWLIKTDSLGNEEWSRTFGGTFFDGCFSVQQTTDSSFILAGSSASFGENGDVWLIKTDDSGNEEWSRTFGGGGTDEAWSVQQTEDGGFILAGYTGTDTMGSWNAWLIRTDHFGNEVWNRTFGERGWDEALSVQQTEDGSFILAGFTDSYGVGSRDAWLIKTCGE
jgi:hypothetical protein